jgi:pimeloyl-ACP methyl ester carboxylesterase
MKLNKIIFPAPKSSYTANQLLGEVIYIPRTKEAYLTPQPPKTSFFGSSRSASSSDLANGRSSFIPCLYLPYTSGSSKLLIYFHGNAEDVGLSYEMLDHLRSSLKVNILAVEYPGYGIYKDTGGCNADKITDDAAIVFAFVVKET